jgi:hypothetical protein
MFELSALFGLAQAYAWNALVLALASLFDHYRNARLKKRLTVA